MFKKIILLAIAGTLIIIPTFIKNNNQLIDFFKGLKLLQDLSFTELFLLSLSLFILLCYVLYFILLKPFYLGLSFWFFKQITKRGLVPKISWAEKASLQAGSPGIEKHFFTGQANFKSLLAPKMPQLTKEEKHFLNTKVETLCEMSNEWELLKAKKLCDSTKEFLKTEKFFGLGIPKQYKGLGFSPFAIAKIIEKLNSHNSPLAIMTMVPNSLGPAKLLLNYGTEDQKNKHLPQLATGQQIPCFALTEPLAGSDASSITSQGVLFKDKGELKILLNWEKRWITLAAEATLIGLAIRLKDPDQLYSKKTDLGITCLLIPNHLKGIEQPFYHNPMNIPIHNGTIKGKNVVVPAKEAIVGGLKQAGKGWPMIIETLSAGRGISLPALSVGSSKKVAWLTGTHAFVRKQFKLPIGEFDGVKSTLALIAGKTHLISAVQHYNLSLLQVGEGSSVASSLTKYNLTEVAHEVIKKGLDVMGGAGLSLGPKNKIATLYFASPMALTAEGANILTRTLIVYGQGLIKTHPFIYKIITSLQQNDFKSFYKHFGAFIKQFVKNFFKSIAFCLTRLWIFPSFQHTTKDLNNSLLEQNSTTQNLDNNLLEKNNTTQNLNNTHTHTKQSHKLSAKEKSYFKKLKTSSLLFAYLSDLSFLHLKGDLKKHGQLTGCMADILSCQYMVSALLWDYLNNKKKSWLKTKWALEDCFFKIQNSFIEVLNNYPSLSVRLSLKFFVLLLRLNPLAKGPSYKLNQQLGKQLLKDEEFKKELCCGMYFSKNLNDQFYKLNIAYHLALKEEKILKKLKQKTKQLNTKSNKHSSVTPQTKKYLQTNNTVATPQNNTQTTKNTPTSPQTSNPTHSNTQTSSQTSNPTHSNTQTSPQTSKQIQKAWEQGLISKEEKHILLKAQQARWEAIQVDSFTKKDYFKI